MEPESRHQCLIYDGAPSAQLPAIAAVIRQRLAEGYRCLYLNSPPMVAGLRSQLSALGIDVASEIDRRRLVLTSEPPTSAGSSFDVNRMLNQLEQALDDALKDGFKGLWATGDMTWEFGSEKNLDKLLQYELRLDALIREREALCGICQYHRDSLPRDVTREGLMAHRKVFINETLSRINPHYIPFRLPDDLPPTNSELDEAIAAFCQSQNPNP